MQLLLGFCLLFLLNFSEVKAADLEIVVKDQKIALPYWPYKNKTQLGGVLIVHGGQSDDGLILVDKLGKQLAKFGWSVALLNIKTQAAAVPWIEQLPEALSALRQKDNDRIVLLHYGSELQVLMGYFAKLQSKQVNGLILLSAFDQSKDKDSSELLQKLSFPLLDIIGQFDYETVLKQAAVRQQNNQNKEYLYVQLPGGSHDYSYIEKLLLAYLHGWMKKLHSSIPAKPPIILDKKQAT